MSGTFYQHRLDDIDELPPNAIESDEQIRPQTHPDDEEHDSVVNEDYSDDLDSRNYLMAVTHNDDDDEHDAGYYTRVVSVLLFTNDLLNLVDA